MKWHSNSSCRRSRPAALIVGANEPASRKVYPGLHAFQCPIETCVARAIRRSWAAGHDSLFTNRYSPLTRILIGSAAIKIARNPTDYNAKPFTNRPKKACFRAPFARVLRSTSRHSRVTTPAFLIATEEIRNSSNLLTTNQTTFSNRYSFSLFGAFSASRLAPIPPRHSCISSPRNRHVCPRPLRWHGDSLRAIFLPQQPLMPLGETKG
jgi:hypothetical protein